MLSLQSSPVLLFGFEDVGYGKEEEYDRKRN